MLLPTFELPIASGPLPLGTRYTFTRDSLLLTDARTLSDLLAHIPGVYVARGGWFGQAEIVLYGGRGPAALEIYWDGFPLLPLGRDSIWHDPARIPIAPLDRIDVIVSPVALQVYLVTAQPRSSSPQSQVGIVTGDQDVANYRVGYARRTRSGFGVSVAADWNSVGQTSPGSSTTTFNATDLWLKLDYVPPGGRVGASFQISSSSWKRDPDPRVDGWRQDRRDRMLRVFLAQRDDGLGLRFTATLGSSGISHDTLVAERNVSAARLELQETWRTGSVSGIAQLGAAGFPTQLEARGGWRPIPRVTLAGAVRHARYAGDRDGSSASLTGSIGLLGGLSARAELRWRNDVQSALYTNDGLQQTTDVAGWVRFDHPRLAVEVGRGRRDPFQPLGFAFGIKSVDSLSRTPLTEFVAAHAVLRPVAGVELAGWYYDPQVGGGDFEPPHHARMSLTFYSKFWRVFRSGIFALRGELAIESWSRWGLGGTDSGGPPRQLYGATFAETNLEMQLGGVTIFWIVRNVNIMHQSYVDGLGYPKSAQMYGARWFFTN